MRRSWNGKHEQCPLCTGHIFQSLRQRQDMVFWLSHLLKRCSATPLAAYLVACAVFMTTSSDAVSLRPRTNILGFHGFPKSPNSNNCFIVSSKTPSCGITSTTSIQYVSSEMFGDANGFRLGLSADFRMFPYCIMKDLGNGTQVWKLNPFMFHIHVT